MFARKLIAISALAVTTIVPTFAFAASPDAAPCILRDHRVTGVKPYKVTEHAGRASTQRLRGAEVFVQAEKGLTAEWLQLALTRHLAEMQGPAGMRDCAFDVNDVTLRVDSAGTGFSVKIIAKESGKAAEVLRRAQLLLG
jgi:hypothetical protein